MTDEEKAEITKEYLNKTFKQTEENQLAIMIGSKCFYEGLEEGLSEGRKELEKENEQLKAEKQQIIERERIVPEHYLVEMIEKNKKLKAQIESLASALKEIADYSDCKASANIAKKELNKWKLAE